MKKGLWSNFDMKELGATDVILDIKLIQSNNKFSLTQITLYCEVVEKI